MDVASHMAFPVHCPVCGKAGVVACQACLDALISPKPPKCLVCGKSFPCPSHPASPALLFGALHDGKARDLVLRLKYDGYKALGREMGRALARNLRRPEGELLTPVPLHKRSERPYNQARALACGISDVWKIPTEEGLKWVVDVGPQTKLGASSRRTLPKDALEWRGLPLNGKTVIIVDDVCTTGSTLSCAACAVEKAGGFPAAAIAWSVSL